MTTRYDVMTEDQRELVPSLAPLRHLDFVLYGGTAVALRLGHRESIDFDFFTDATLDREKMRSAIPALANATPIQDQADAWSVLVPSPRPSGRPVKLSFFSGLDFGRVGRPTLDDNGHLLLASMDDLLAHKLKVLLQRVEVKDYQDIAAMLQAGLSLEKGLGAALSLFPNFPPCEALKALVYFQDEALSELSDSDRAELVAKADHARSPIAVPILSKHLAQDS